jgi:hypothetical protein
MNPMSDRMRDVASTSNVRVSKAVLYSNNMPVMELPISEGSVTVDSEAAVRRSMTAKIVGREDLVPARAADLLFPNVNEVKLYTGFQYSPADPKRYLTADEEFVSQGIFRIDKPEIEYCRRKRNHIPQLGWIAQREPREIDSMRRTWYLRVEATAMRSLG